jgi:hypothetical protein
MIIMMMILLLLFYNNDDNEEKEDNEYCEYKIAIPTIALYSFILLYDDPKVIQTDRIHCHHHYIVTTATFYLNECRQRSCVCDGVRACVYILITFCS